MPLPLRLRGSQKLDISFLPATCHHHGHPDHGDHCCCSSCCLSSGLFSAQPYTTRPKGKDALAAEDPYEQWPCSLTSTQLLACCCFNQSMEYGTSTQRCSKLGSPLVSYTDLPPKAPLPSIESRPEASSPWLPGVRGSLNRVHGSLNHGSL